MSAELTPPTRRRPIPEGTIDVTDASLPNTPTERPGTRSIVVIGAGGHGRELADIVRDVSQVGESVSLLGIADDGDPDRALLARSGIRFLGTSGRLDERELDIFVGIGDPMTREKIDHRLSTEPTPLIHPSALTGSKVTLGAGVVLAQRVVLTTNVRLGRHTHVNVGATIAHDCVLGAWVTVCPGATVTGAVNVGDRVFIGAGATILPGVKIGNDAVIGAGATVTNDVLPGNTVVGSPARPIER